MEHKQEITVVLKVQEIIFDIMNKTHLTGHAREAEGKKNYESASYMQASEDDEASYQIRRSVSNAIAALKVRLGEYLNEDKTTTDNLINQAVDNDGEVVLAFKMPSNFHNAAIDSLGGGCHQYVCNKAIFDWYVLVNPEEAAVYNTLADESLETAKRALYKRARPTRPVYGSGKPEGEGNTEEGTGNADNGGTEGGNTEGGGTEGGTGGSGGPIDKVPGDNGLTEYPGNDTLPKV